ncbi:tetratricopeptide repeat protein [Vibrio sp. LaRot3]|uniref:tetratricopeptide repeat protein n=1 Tax=Vibrio sp. LaRot3 TaxID=2998829 RepID=UPI0022CDD21F|nr:tetratricopeptide repeat protein [Vibrio sp. LaRot3]MDA0150559.1 tetratricopeptide repeat protein [Vibrio sp. LaRot3]
MSETDSRLVDARNTLAFLESKLAEEPTPAAVLAVSNAMIRVAYAYDDIGDSRAENDVYQQLIERFSGEEDTDVIKNVLEAYLNKAINLAHRIPHDGCEGHEFFKQAIHAVTSIEHPNSPVTLHKLNCYHAGFLADLGEFEKALSLYSELTVVIEQSDLEEKTVAAESRLHAGCLKLSQSDFVGAKHEFNQLLSVYDKGRVDSRSAIYRHIKRAKDFVASIEQITELGFDWAQLSQQIRVTPTPDLLELAYQHLYAFSLVNNHRRMADFATTYLDAISTTTVKLEQLGESWQGLLDLMLEQASYLSDVAMLDDIFVRYTSLVKAHDVDVKQQRSMWQSIARSYLAIGHAERAISIYQDFIEQNKAFTDATSHQYIARSMYNLGVALGNVSRHQEALECYRRLLNRYQGDCEDDRIQEMVYLAKKNSYFAAKSAHKQTFVTVKEELVQNDFSDEQQLHNWLAATQQAFDWGLYDDAIDVAALACQRFGIKGVDSDYYAADDYGLADEDDWLEEWEGEGGFDEEGVVRPNKRAQAIATQPLFVRECLSALKLLLIESVKNWNNLSVTSSACDSVLYDAVCSLVEVHNPQQSDVLYSNYLDGLAEALEYAERECYSTREYLKAIESIIPDSSWPEQFAVRYARLCFSWAKLNDRADQEQAVAMVNKITEQFLLAQSPALEASVIHVSIFNTRYLETRQSMQQLSACWQSYLLKETSVEESRALAQLCIKQVELAQELDDEGEMKRWITNYLGYFSDVDLYGYQGLEEMLTILEDLE